MTPKEELHRLVDELPEEELGAAVRYLEYLRSCGDPLLHSLMTVPEDDELESEDEKIAIQEAYEDLEVDQVKSLEEVKKDLGL
jgi:hypothetical protein